MPFTRFPPTARHRSPGGDAGAVRTRDSPSPPGPRLSPSQHPPRPPPPPAILATAHPSSGSETLSFREWKSNGTEACEVGSTCSAQSSAAWCLSVTHPSLLPSGRPRSMARTYHSRFNHSPEASWVVSGSGPSWEKLLQTLPHRLCVDGRCVCLHEGHGLWLCVVFSSSGFGIRARRPFTK